MNINHLIHIFVTYQKLHGVFAQTPLAAFCQTSAGLLPVCRPGRIVCIYKLGTDLYMFNGQV